MLTIPDLFWTLSPEYNSEDAEVMDGLNYELADYEAAEREALLKEQREIKRSLKEMQGKTLSLQPKVYQRETPKIKSLNTGLGNATKAPSKVYTGTEMIGIGQMHKSNAVPIFRKDDAKDIASMRS